LINHYGIGCLISGSKEKFIAIVKELNLQKLRQAVGPSLPLAA
jgi:hypothetical protein